MPRMPKGSKRSFQKVVTEGAVAWACTPVHVWASPIATWLYLETAPLGGASG